MARSTIILMILSVSNVLVSMVTELLIAAHYGASSETDNYLVACTIPLVFVNLLSGIASSILVPLFVDAKVKQGEDKAWLLASTLMWWMVGCLVMLAVVFSLNARSLIAWSAPGLNEVQRSHCGMMLYWFCGVMIFMTLNTCLIGMHNTQNRFAFPTMSIPLAPLGTLLGAITLGHEYGILGAAIGQFFGTVVQFVMLSMGTISPSRLWFRATFFHSGVKQAFYMAAPLVLGGAAFQFLPVVERYFASNLDDGRIYQMGIANRITNTLAMLMISSLATTMFPRLSEQASSGDMEQARSMLSLATRLILLTVAPVLILSPIYSATLVELLFQRGAFGAADTQAVASVLPWYLLANIAAAVSTLVIWRGFYSLEKNTLVPSVNGAAHVVVYVLLSMLFVSRWGYVGLSIAFTFFWCSTTFISGWMLHRRQGTFELGALATTAIRCVGSALVAFGFAFTSITLVTDLVSRTAVIVMAFLIYAVVARYVFRVDEIRFLMRRLSFQSSA